MENHDYVIIVAGGKGMRMGADVPKQFLPVGGLPVLMHTIRRFRNFNDRMRIILVLPKHQQEYWKELCERHSFCEPIVIADGGETRFHSVKTDSTASPTMPAERWGCMTACAHSYLPTPYAAHTRKPRRWGLPYRWCRWWTRSDIS